MSDPPPVSDILILAPTENELSVYEVNFINEIEQKRGETPPVLILQLGPEKITADSEYVCFLKYGQLKAEGTRRIGIENTGIPTDLDLDDHRRSIDFMGVY